MLQERPLLDNREVLREAYVLDYASYETFCNQNSRSSRKSGILSDEIYDEVLADPTTIFSEIGGVHVPVLVDMKYGLGLGYDEDRARAYAGEDTAVSALAVPIGDLDPQAQADVVNAISLGGPRAIFYADNEGRDEAVLSYGLSANGYAESPLQDRRCRAENRQAALSLFVSDNRLRDGETAGGRRSLGDVQAYFDAQVLPMIEDRDNAALLQNGASFTLDRLEDIWQLYLNKFELLGENHPISMEDSREDFLGLLSNPSTTVAIRYDDGKPACFTYFTENFDALYWLNNKYLQDLADQTPDLTPVFFPGIVAASAGGRHAQEVIGLFANSAARVGMDARIIFENTNLSQMYVPRIVGEGIGLESAYEVGAPVKVDETMYRLATIN